MTAYNYFNII